MDRKWLQEFKKQLPLTLHTSLPMILGQIGLVTMMLIDTYMVSRLGSESLGGVGLGSAIFYVFTTASAGVLFGLDYLVSYARGRGVHSECHHWLWQGVYLSLGLALFVVLILRWFFPFLVQRYFPSEFAPTATGFLLALGWGLPSFLIFITFRQYLQAMGSVRPAMVITILAIASNVLFNWLLIFGNAGFPALGAPGAGYATSITRTVMALSLIAYTFYRDRKLKLGLAGSPKGPNLRSLGRMLRIGAPAGAQYAFESGAFSLTAAMISQVGVASMASHTIALNLASFFYMIPVGLSGATAVLVGHEMGRSHLRGAKIAGWTSIGAIATLMCAIGLVLALLATPLVSLFSVDPAVISLASQLVILVGIFQIADGVQAVGGGALRGLGETRSSMMANLVGYYAVGLPVGYWAGISCGYGAKGFWFGLTVGLFAVAIYIVAEWARQTRLLAHASVKPTPASAHWH